MTYFSAVSLNLFSDRTVNHRKRSQPLVMCLHIEIQTSLLQQLFRLQISSPLSAGVHTSKNSFHPLSVYFWTQQNSVFVETTASHRVSTTL